MAKTIYFNPGPGPVVYTNDGRSVGAGERVELSGLDDTGKAALDRGHLAMLTQPASARRPEGDVEKPEAESTSARRSGK